MEGSNIFSHSSSFEQAYALQMNRDSRLSLQNNRWQKLNPLFWSKRTVRTCITIFLLIILPVYVFIGFRPATSLDYTNLPELSIDRLQLSTPVENLTLTNHQLIAPDLIAGSFSQHTNKTLIIGHSSSVFKDLSLLQLGDQFIYDSITYSIVNIDILAKADINMEAVLASAEHPTLILMTCAGDPLPNQDATHRLLLTAEIAE